MKKLITILLILATLISTFGMTACTITFEDGKINFGGNSVSEKITREDGKVISVADLSQTAVKNENFIDTMVSWHDDDYNYFIFNIGQIKNVPLTSTYAIYSYYADVDYTIEQNVVKASASSIEMSTSTVTTSSVTTTNFQEATVKSELSAGWKGVVDANVSSGYTKSTTNVALNETVWSESYKESVSFSQSESNTMSLTFNSSCKKGNYLYLHLGDITVYYTVVQSRYDTEECYIETYNKIDNNRYALIYAGESTEFPINEKSKIEIDGSFIKNLPAPEKYIEGKSCPVVKEVYWSETYSEDGNKGTLPFICGIDNFSEYYSKGYNKIKISFDCYATGGWALLGGDLNLFAYVCTEKNINSKIKVLEYEVDDDGKWISGSATTDLRWFESSQSICIIFYAENKSEDYTVGKMTITATLYKE